MFNSVYNIAWLINDVCIRLIVDVMITIDDHNKNENDQGNHDNNSNGDNSYLRTKGITSNVVRKIIAIKIH